MPHRDQQVFIGQRSYHQSPFTAGSRAGVILLALLLSLTLIIAGTVTAQQSSDLIPLPALPGEEVIRLGRGEAQAAMFSPNGSLLAVGTNLGLWLYNATDLAATPTLMIRDITITSVEFNPTSDRVVISRSNNTAEVYDVATGSLLLTLTGHTGVVNHASYSPDGTRIVTASDDNTARVWNAATGTSFGSMAGHTDLIYTAYFSPDNSKIVSASQDGTARLWDANTNALLYTMGSYYAKYNAYFSPDGTKVISTDGYETHLWDVATGAPSGLVNPSYDGMRAARYNQAGTQIAVANAGSLYLYNAADLTLTNKIEGNSAYSASISYHPDGTRIASVERSDIYPYKGLQSVVVYTLPTTPDQLLSIPNVHTTYLNSLDYSPDGGRLISTSSDHTAKIWNAETGALLLTLTSPYSVGDAAFSPDGTRVAIASRDGVGYGIFIKDASTGASIHNLYTSHNIDQVTWNHEGTRVAAGGFLYTTVYVWDAVNGGAALLTLSGHTDGVRDLDFSPDGTLLASASDKVRLWNAATGELVQTLPTGGYSVDFSPDGSRVVVGGGITSASIWEVSTGRLLNTFDYCWSGLSSSGMSLEYTSDGTRLVGTGCGIVVLDSQNGAQLKSVAPTWDETVRALAIRPDGQRIATLEDGDGYRINVWDITVGLGVTRLDWHTDDYNAVAYSADGTRAAGSDYTGRVRVWNAATGALLLTVCGACDDPAGDNSDNVDALIRNNTATDTTFSPDGTRLAISTRNDLGYVFDSSSGALLATLSGHTGDVHSIAFSADGTRLVTTSWDKSARIWDAATGQLVKVLNGHTSIVTDAAFSPDGTLVATSGIDGMRTWDVNTGSQVTLISKHNNSVAFNSDGTRIIGASTIYGTTVWQTDSGLQLLNIAEGSYRAAFSPDDSLIVTAGEDGSLKLYNTYSGELKLVLEGHFDDVTDAVFHPGGSQIASASNDGTVRIWEVGTTEPVGTNVIVNGGFEDSTAVGAPWVLKNGTKDKIKSNKPDKVIAHSGTNAFQFKGGGSENSRLQQKVDLTAHNFSENHVLDLSLWSRASKSGVEATVKFQVTYDDGTEPDKTTLKVGTSTTWTESMGSITLASEDVLKIQVQIKFTASSGKVYIDDVTLVHTPTGSRFGGIILPLP